MTSLIFDSRVKGPEGLFASHRGAVLIEELETWLVESPEEAFTASAVAPGEVVTEVVTEDVEGLPLLLVKLYAEIALRHATSREVDPGVWMATVVGLDGAWGDGDTPEEALEELHDAIMGWVAVKRRVGATDIPPMEGVDLNHPI